MKSTASVINKRRIGWLDAAKGIGILFVVIGHALGGIIDSPLGLGQSGLRIVFFAIYLFHMPLFFLLSGLLVARRLQKGSMLFVSSLIPTIVWPYFLWSAMQFSIIFALGALVNRPAESYWSIILALPWSTVSQFWFLYALFWLHLIAAFLVPRIGREAFLFLGLGLKALVLIVSFPVAIKLVCNHAFFYCVGVYLGAEGMKWVVLRHRALIKAEILPFAALLMILLTIIAAPQFGPDIPLSTAQSPDIANLAWRFPALAAAMLAVAACVGVASLAPIASSRWLATLGQLTMPIFLLHILFIAGTRIVALKFHLVSSPVIMLALTIVIGLVAPLIVERATRALGLNRLIGFG
jgi:fucose 4-O-acetylase-like acetyltransferase